MGSFKSEMGFGGHLDTRVIRAPQRRPVRSLWLPGVGKFSFTRDKGEGNLLGKQYFSSTLQAVHRNARGEIVDVRDLGSGLVTDAGVLSMANDFAWPAPSAAAINIIRLANTHATGTGATAAAVTDIKLQTPSAFGGQTRVTGVQSLIQATTAGTGTTGTQKYQTVATVSYTGTEAVTEWGLFGNLGALGGTGLTDATKSPFTAGSATSGTVTGALTASSTTVQGQANTILENTNVTRVSWGLVLSNDAAGNSVATVGAWYLTATGAAGTAPVAADTLVFRPVMWDHRVFAAINVNNGDSIQFTYQLIPNQGG